MIYCKTIFIYFVIITFDCDLVKSYSRDKRSESFEISASHDMPKWSKHLPDISEEEQHDSVKTKSDNVVANNQNEIDDFSLVDEKVRRFLESEKGTEADRRIVGKSISVGLQHSESGDEDTVDKDESPLKKAEIGGFDLQCTACYYGAKVLIEHHRMGLSPETLVGYISFFCGALKIQSKSVCQGIVKSVGQQLFAVLDLANGTVAAEDICGMVYGGSCALYSKRLNNWFLDIPDLKLDPPTSPPEWPRLPTASAEKILHLSDTHIQLDYQEGMNSHCDSPICCSANEGKAPTLDTAAGPFGDYHCDLPRQTFDRMMRETKEQHPDIKYIFLTGDFPAHDVWRQNRSLNIESVQTVVNILEEHFPDAKVFPAIGNHESFPVNMFPDPTVNGRYAPSWLYSNVAKLYKTWLPEQQQQATLKDGGYFSVLMRPHLRVVSINTNFCNNLNFWLLLNFADPHYHLHWLYRQLHKAEINKERVFLLGHIPPGSESCLDRWSREYNRLVYRFRNTIIGQFFGHTHFDEFELFFAPPERGSEAVSVAYLAPSQTPHDGLNPAYRVYTIDGDHPDTTNLILDHQTFWLNLTESNARISEPKINLKLEYSAKDSFGLENMSGKSWYNFVQRMAVNDQLFETYRRFYSRSGPYYLHRSCDQNCREEMLCALVTSRPNEKSKCKEIKKLIASHYRAANREANQATWWNYIWPSEF